jgi:hypothetical protein
MVVKCLETALKSLHLAFDAPITPLKPTKQLPQVLATVSHGSRFNSLQRVTLAPVQFSTFKVFAALFTTWMTTLLSLTAAAPDRPSDK